MKKRNQILKSISAVFCALVVFVSLLGVDGSFLATVTPESEFLNLELSDFVDEYDYEAYCDYSNDTFYVSYLGYELLLRFNSNSPYYLSSSGYCPGVGGNACFKKMPNGLWTRYSTGPYGGTLESFIDKMKSMYSLNIDLPTLWYYSDLPSEMVIYTTIDFSYKYLGMSKYEKIFGFTGWSSNYNDVLYGKYNSSFGYLQNVSRKSTYIRDFLYNYDDDSLTYHWYHDLQSTSGVDLTSGEYNIRHYISNATVKGYEKDDIVEMSEKYLMAEYDASQGYFTYLQKDYLEKLESLGYVDPSWIDIYFKGYFVLQHHYFQIVNTSTNEVGGYLHIYPKDATDDNFGVELMYEGTDLDGNIDEDAPNGYFDSTTGSGETLEDALENADEPKLDDLSGMQEFIDTIETYGSQVENVSKGFGALLGEFPPWFLGVLGFSFALLFIVVIVSAMKG